MIDQLSVAQIDSLDLVPVAAIGVETDRFRDLGIAFHHGIDDLDAYEIAAFSKLGTGTFALMHYLNAPLGGVTLLVERKAADEAGFIPIMRTIAELFDVPVGLFHWQVDGKGRRLSQELVDSV